ncbi:MAG: hypothetical protein JW996_00425 [Candidatus Cloacimonetes bacterium]|nr:hypothetical protein [Candidatus Cloacimonadota bacterium]
MEVTDATRHFLLQPFFIGLYIGLLLAIILFIKSLLDKAKLKKEIKKLKQHLQSKLEIESESTERKRLDLEKIKEINENLRITVQNLKQKPGRRELRQLYLYQQALELMIERAPGFAQAWQVALKESEEELLKSEKGLLPFLRKLIPPSYPDRLEE